VGNYRERIGMANYTWVGGSSGALGLAANYSPAVLPGPGDQLTIASKTTYWPSSGISSAGVVVVAPSGVVQGGTFVGLVTMNGVYDASAGFAIPTLLLP
jgi:hypothetical protein